MLARYRDNWFGRLLFCGIFGRVSAARYEHLRIEIYGAPGFGTPVFDDIG
jgi:hypothetical protein